MGLTGLSYLLVTVAVSVGLLPLSSIIILGTLPLFGQQIQLYTRPADSPLHYVRLTMTTFLLSVAFGLLLALSLVVG